MHVPGQRGNYLFVRHKPSRVTAPSHKPQHSITFLDTRHAAAVQDRPGLLVSGIMLVSIRLLWSGTGSPTINNLKSYTLKPHYSPFLNPIEDLFSAWRCCVYDYQHQAACLFCRQWNRRRWGKVNPWMDSAQGSISTPTHNRCVFLYLQYSIHSVFLVYFCLNLIYCTVKYSSAMYSIAYYIFWLLGKLTLWNWIKTVNMKDCSVSYKVD